MTDYKTLRVPKDAWEEAKAQKEEHGRTWGEQLLHFEPQDGPDVVIENVEVSEGAQGLTEEDVENIVESWLERNLDRLQRGQI